MKTTYTYHVSFSSHSSYLPKPRICRDRKGLREAVNDLQQGQVSDTSATITVYRYHVGQDPEKIDPMLAMWKHWRGRGQGKGWMASHPKP